MLSKVKLRPSALILLTGSLLAVTGEVINAFNNIPLGTTWYLTIVLIVLGTLILVYGVNTYAQPSEHTDASGKFSSGILFLAGIVAIVGIIAIDGMVLPLLFGIASKIEAIVNPMSSGLQSATDSVTSSVNNIINSAMNIFNPGSGHVNIPTGKVPRADGVSIVNSMLVGLKLPALGTIANWGHIFLTGGPLAIGGLLLGLSLLRIPAFPRQAAAFLAICASLNLLLQFLIIFKGANSVLLILTNVAGILFFLALAWLGLAFLYPEKMNVAFYQPLSK